MNIMVKIGDEIITPPLGGAILAGITRDSVLTLLRGVGDARGGAAGFDRRGAGRGKSRTAGDVGHWYCSGDFSGWWNLHSYKGMNGMSSMTVRQRTLTQKLYDSRSLEFNTEPEAGLCTVGRGFRWAIAPAR